MIRKKGKRLLAALLGAALCVGSAGQPGVFVKRPVQAFADTQRAATVGATTLNVRSGPGTGNSIVKKLDYGTAVTVIGEAAASDGVLWYKIRFNVGGQTLEGYASSQYIKFPTAYSHDADFEAYLNQQGFPESYKDSLRTLHAENPTWIFQVQKTGLDWNEVIKNEAAVGANLVDKNSISSWKSIDYGAYDWNTGKWTGFDGATWVAASKEIVSYYMDPRNFLNDVYVFQFLVHSYDGSLQTKSGLESMAKGTFLEKTDNNAGTGGGGDTGSSGGNSGMNLAPGENIGPGFANQPQESVPAESQNSSSAANPDTETSGNTGNVGPGEAPGTGNTAPEQNGSSQNEQDIGLEGPPVSLSARELPVTAVPNVEYGPGMDASAITGDNTGAASSSPIPTGKSYVDIIMDAATQSGVNPYVIGAMLLQEQGEGKSGSISGQVSGYEGIYNFFNIGAYDTGSMSAVTRGLWYASQSGSYGRPWNSIEKSIAGGASYYAENFVKAGQDTFYLKKFNVQGSNLYKHQYMTNVEGAAGEGAKLARAYTDEMKKEPLVFKIPVYENMPETACAKPTVSGSPNNKLSAIEVTGYALTPTFNMDTESYDIIVNPSVEQIQVNVKTIDSTAKVNGGGTVDLRNGVNSINIEVTAQNGSVRTYRLNVVRQESAPVVNVPADANLNPDGQASGGLSTDGQNVQGNVGPGMTGGPGGTGVGTNVSINVPNSSDVQVGVGPGGSSNP